jgi:ADP-heptose:LPS heptosyltransferase
MNILIIKLGALGDIVMATPLIEAIQRFHANDKVHLLTAAPFETIFRPWQGLHVTIHPRRGALNLARTSRWIRRLKCARIYDLQGSDRSGLMCALSGARIRVGNHPRFPYTHHPGDAWTGQSHIFKRMITVLAAADVNEVASAPTIPASRQEQSMVEQWLATNSLIAGTFVLLHAGTSDSRPEKRWPYFKQLGRRLAAAGLQPIWIGAGQDGNLNRQLKAAAGGLDATDAFSVPALAEFARHARFAVTNDSGPMHVLSASRIPVFGLFGPSDWRRNHAIGQIDNVIAGVECLPRYRGEKTEDCLEQISCDMVWERLAQARMV